MNVRGVVNSVILRHNCLILGIKAVIFIWAPSWLTLRSLFLDISLLQNINSVNFPFVGTF